MKIIRAFVAAILWLFITPISTVSDTLEDFRVTVVGADGKPEPGLSIRLTSQKTRQWFSPVRSNSLLGVFDFKLPSGTYVGSLLDDDPCLEGTFTYEVAQGSSGLSIALPSKQDHKLFIAGGRNNSPVAGVSSRIGGKLGFVNPAGFDGVQLKYSCQSMFSRRIPVSVFGGAPVVFTTYKLAKPETYPTRGPELLLDYVDGEGFATQVAIPYEKWFDSDASISLEKIPDSVLSNKVTWKKYRLTGKADYVEVDGVNSERLFVILRRISSGNGKWTGWYKATGVKPRSGSGPLSFSFDGQFYKGKTIELAITGKDFTMTSNVISIKVPK